MWIKSSEMDDIRSNIKKLESKMIEDYPHLQSSKDKIWSKTSKALNEKQDFKVTMKKLVNVNYVAGKEICDPTKYMFDQAVLKKFPYKPSEEVEEKDF